MKEILIDADGVLLNWVKPFEKFMTSRGYLHKKHAYSISDSHDILPETASALLTEFNSSSAISSLEPFPGSIESVRKLFVFHDYRFRVISSISSDKLAHARREKNLRDLYGEIFSGFHFLECGGDKTEILSSFKSSIWIEDKPENAEIGYSLGHKTYLLTQPYNENIVISDGITRCSDWYDLYEQIAK